MSHEGLVSVLHPVQATFRAVAETVVPETTSLHPDDWSSLEHDVEGVLATRPPRVQRQLVLFLRALDVVAVARHLRVFRRLDPLQRTALLLSLQDSPLLLVRRGFWGLRTLVLLGYYGRDDVQAALGYRPHPAGWGARRTTGEMRAATAAEAAEMARASAAVMSGEPWDPPEDETRS